VDLTTAYHHCQHITTTRARNFSYGIRLLPQPKRAALCAVYAFARRIDDIADANPDANPDGTDGDGTGGDGTDGDGTGGGTLSTEQRYQQLTTARNDLTHLTHLTRHTTTPTTGPTGPTGHLPSTDPVLVALADAAARYPIPLDAFAELIDGVEADLTGTTYDTYDDLLHYCRCVAGSIGRLSLGIFGATDPQVAAGHADALGIALQLTNILRDLRDDATNGRIYLPKADRIRYGWDTTTLPVDLDGLDALVRFEAARARGWFARGLALLPLLDRRSAACVAAMAGIYHKVLDRIDRHPRLVLEQRVSLPAWEKALVAATSLMGTHRLVPPREMI
jgi:phytoene synthase